MNEPVTSVLIARLHEPAGLGRMVTLSVAGHVAVAVALGLAAVGAGRGAARMERSVMTISLGGAAGPRTGGMTPIGGRPVQEAAPALKQPEPARAPAKAAPQMTVPVPGAKTPPAKTPVREAPEEAKGRAPTRGPEARAGTAIAETGARGQGFGISSGGGGTGGYLDVGDFCCPEYLSTMIDLIQRNWTSKQGAAGSVLMKFTIQRSGVLTDVQLEKSSGFTILDMQAQRALLLTRQLPPLPRGFTNESLTVHLYFDYQR